MPGIGSFSRLALSMAPISHYCGRPKLLARAVFCWASIAIGGPTSKVHRRSARHKVTPPPLHEHLSGYEKLLLNERAHTAFLNKTCSREGFARALTTLQDRGLLAKWSPTNKAGTVDPRIRRYDELISSGLTCSHDPTIWPVSTKELLIDLGEGTTGTRWLNNVVKKLGYRSMHNLKVGSDHPNQCYSKTKRRGKNDLLVECKCTKIYEGYDFISDSPISYQVYELVMSFPRAKFLLSIRDGEGWQRSRVDHHRSAVNWSAASPCGYGPKMSSAQAAIEEEVLTTWITCFVPRNRLFAFNLFRDNDAANTTSTEVEATVSRMLAELSAERYVRHKR